MGKIAETLRGWEKPRGGATISDALKYIETGDPAALEKVRSLRVWEYWKEHLAGVIPVAGTPSEEDRRALRVLAAAEEFGQIGRWLSRAIGGAKGDGDLHAIVREELEAAGWSRARVASLTLLWVRVLAPGGHPNSAGRYLLSLSDRDMKAAVKQAVDWGRHWDQSLQLRLAEFFLDIAPERLEPLLDVMLDPKAFSPATCEVILRTGADRYERAVADAWRKLKKPDEKFVIGPILVRHDPERYGREMLDLARSVLADDKASHARGAAGIWMIKNHGAEVLGEIVAHLERAAASGSPRAAFQAGQIAMAAVQALGGRALDAVRVAMRTCDRGDRFRLLPHLIELGGDAHDELIRSELELGLVETEGRKRPVYVIHPPERIAYIELAARWKPAIVADRFWELLDHKTKAVREAAARALGRLGAGVVPRASELLADRKADRRALAVIMLAEAGTSEALRALEGRQDAEPDDDVRDAILLALDAAGGREVTREEIDRRIERAASRLQAPVAAWLDESRLPALRDSDGRPLGPEVTRYLLFRQSRAREIRPDIEAGPLYALIDRGTSGDFALEVLRRFVTSKADAKDRWALAIAGLLGDDRVVPILNQMVQDWAGSGRGQMAEWAVQALGLLGTDAALMSVDDAATRYRVKNKNVGAAAEAAFAAVAERLGVTIDELGDRVVPWLGFEPGKPRIIEDGGKRVEITIGPDFKLRYRDLEKGKIVASLPKGLPKETLAEFKEMGATLREVARVQKLRLENLMVCQHRWPVSRWRELFLDHPVLFGPFATRLVWGHYDEALALVGTFRAMEDRTLTDAADQPFRLPETGSVGIVHPLELDDESLGAWRNHLADYEVEPPFPQLERPVLRVGDDRRDVRMSPELAGTSLNALTFRGRAEKLGWVRGSVTNAGHVDSYRKVFPAVGVEAFIDLEGLFVSPGMDQSVEPGEFYFVKAGSVSVGSYCYDNPSDEGDPRLIAFGAVPPVVFSEVMGDLKRIAGQSEESDQGDD